MIIPRVRITHHSTGLQVCVSAFRSVMQNKAVGLSLLRSLLAYGDAPRRPVRTYRFDEPMPLLATPSGDADFARLIEGRLRAVRRKQA